MEVFTFPKSSRNRPHSSSVRKTVLWDRFSDSFPPGEAMGAFAPKKARRLSSPGFRVCQKSSCLPPFMGAPQGGFSCPTGNSPSGNPHPCDAQHRPVPEGPEGERIATAFGLAMTVVVGRWYGFAGMHTSVQLLLPAPSVSKLTAPPRLRAGEPWVRIRRGAVGRSVHTAERHRGRSLQGPISHLCA